MLNDFKFREEASLIYRHNKRIRRGRHYNVDLLRFQGDAAIRRHFGQMTLVTFCCHLVTIILVRFLVLPQKRNFCNDKPAHCPNSTVHRIVI